MRAMPPSRFVRLLAAALVLLGLGTSSGCRDKPTGPTDQQKPDPGRRMPK